jgi:uncharacterized membrane protein YqjE
MTISREERTLGQTGEELRGIGSEFGSIAQDVRDLARMEVRLARAELKEQVSLIAWAAAFGGLAAIAAATAILFAFVTFMLVLWELMPMWAAALITTLLIASIGILAYALAREQMRKLDVIPERTIRSVREDMRCLRDQINSSFR